MRKWERKQFPLTGPQLIRKINESFHSDVAGFHDVWDLAAEAREEQRIREWREHFVFYKSAQNENCDLRTDLEGMSEREKEFCGNKLRSEGCGTRSCESQCHDYNGIRGTDGSGETDSDGTRETNHTDPAVTRGPGRPNSGRTTGSDEETTPEPDNVDDDGIVTCLALGCTDPVPDPIIVEPPCKLR